MRGRAVLFWPYVRMVTGGSTDLNADHRHACKSLHAGCMALLAVHAGRMRG